MGFADTIDWGSISGPESECECWCGEVFFSHAKIVYEPTAITISEVSCPRCGKRERHLKRISILPEIPASE